MTAFRNNGLTAHRGNPAGFPENTLPGFADGLASGADWLETDVHRTRDGQVVVCHDATTGRTADGDLVIAESTLAELKRLDFSAWNVATPARMRALVRLGVWRLYADAPRALAAVLRREGRSL